MARRRVLLYAHDGMGLGHLRRISRLAAALKDEFSTLVLSWMREAAWIVPDGCGLVKLPDWDGMTPDRAGRAGTEPWIDLDREGAAVFRARAILDIARLYRPDALIVDYLPFGQRRELEALLALLPCRRYFLHRGIADSSDAAMLRGGPATKAIAAHYDRILVASDMRLGNVADDDGYSDAARAILSHVGFIAPDDSPPAIAAPFVACSSGGGYLAEPLMRACVAVARRHPDIPFRVVLGPRSRLRVADLDAPANCEMRQQRKDLPALHATAAVVVSTGGYNSMLEAAFGGAMLIVHPKHVGDDDEQRRFAGRLGLHHPLRLIEDPAMLEAALLDCWHRALTGRRAPLMLERYGGARIRAILSRDLAEGPPAGRPWAVAR